MIRDYSNKTSDEWFDRRKWTGFLTQIPPGKTVIKECRNARDLQAIRVTASLLNLSEDCPIRYAVKGESNSDRVVIIETARK